MTFNQEITTERSTAIGEDKKVEVCVDGDQAVIRMSSYADGIGWYVQKTMLIDAVMLDALADQFTAARGKIQREGDDILSADLIEF